MEKQSVNESNHDQPERLNPKGFERMDDFSKRRIKRIMKLVKIQAGVCPEFMGPSDSLNS
jgi:hypothetical protein